MQKDNDCYWTDLINEDGILTTFARKLYHKNGSKLSELFDNLNSVPIGGITFGKEKEIPNIKIMLEELIESVASQKKYVVVTIDEANNSKAIQSLAKEFNALKRQKYPIFVIMTGLPDLILYIQNDDKLTFLLRSEKIEMQPLSVQDITFAYQNVFDNNFEVANRMVKMTRGYSYAFQLQGYIYFNYLQNNELSSNNENLNNIFTQYKTMLFNNAYQKIFSGLSDTDRKYLSVITDNPIFKDAVKVMGKSGSYVFQYRRRMLERHLIMPVGHDEVTYTLPLFREFVKETQNPDSEFYWYI